MNRNKARIMSTDQVLTAARTVYMIVKLLKLTQRQYLDMFKVDVHDQISHFDSLEQRLLQVHADGVRDVYLTVLMTEHCEFVYQLTSGVKVGVKEATQQGADWSLCGYQWRDSDLEFTTFEPEVDIWI